MNLWDYKPQKSSSESVCSSQKEYYSLHKYRNTMSMY